eukprot:1135345-Alexandrium_andersonii.AAC.1
MAFMQSLAVGIDSFLGFKEGSPITKQRKRESRTGSPAPPEAFNPQQSKWLEEAVGGALKHLGGAVDERVSKVEAE